MEPQAAVAMPDEGGAMLVHSSTQCIDMIQTGVAAALNLTYNQVIARAPPRTRALEVHMLSCRNEPAVQPGHRACAPSPNAPKI